MKNAVVTAYELDDSGERLDTPVGTTTTDNEGQYRIELNDNYEGGLVEIEITVNSETRMVCDASACGTKGSDVTLPGDFKLNAIGKASAPGSAVSVPVTAWSTMAAKRAKTLVAGGKSVADAARQAKAEVSQVAGFDIENTVARDVNDLTGASAAEAQAAVMNAAVAELVFSGGENVAATLDSFSDALNDGSINSEDTFTAASLSSAVKTVVETTDGLDDETQESLNNQTAQFDAAGDNLAPSYDEELDLDEGATQADKVAAFQSFVSQFRSWAGSIDETAAALQDETSAVSVALDADAETVSDVFAQAGVTGDLVSKVLDAFSQQLAGTEGRAALLDALENGTPFTAPLNWTDEEDPTVTGTMDAELVFEDTESGLKATATGSVSQIGGETREFDLVIGTSLSQSDLDLTYDAEKVLSLLAQNNVSVSGTVGDGTGFDRAALDLVANLELSESIAGEVTADAVLEKFSAITLNGSVALANPEAASFDGEISVKAVNMTGSSFSALDEPFSPESFALAGDFTATSGRTFNLSTSLNSSSAQRFNLFTYLDYNDTTAAFDFEVDRAEVSQFVEYDETAQDFWFDIYSYGSCYDFDSGTEVFGERVANSGWYDSELGFYDYNCNVLDSAENDAVDQLILGKLETAVGATVAGQSSIQNVWVSGSSASDLAEVNADITFPDLETAENFVNLSFNIAAGVSLADMPKATAVVTLTRSTLNGGSVLANVSWDGGSYSLKVSTDELNAENPEVSLAFWNPQGFRLEAVGSETASGVQSLTGNVFVNGEDIGDVELRNGVPVITYPNGEETVFETLF
ncbi:hypothetical protein KYE_00359 [Marinobacter manganoxydans MnI7-9]|uniref:Uncharacterized protein n=1 Tax=Marinobacter manganoxydans MnI7-9 TaxID=1094979 RepID=G6YMM1_9GAMM|nr:hypothetical protein KYE_00359 [Marinobacter manganoxydans MnI7-9]|tara:strand:+ start:663 stop:3092 length:2430 start_codon:yes stop_codon:yes gene_type:complete